MLKVCSKDYILKVVYRPRETTSTLAVVRDNNLIVNFGQALLLVLSSDLTSTSPFLSVDSETRVEVNHPLPQDTGVVRHPTS